MSATRIAELAAAAGATLPAPLPPNEIAGFVLQRSGDLRIMLVDGADFVVMADAEVPAQFRSMGLASSDVLRILRPLVPHADVRVGVEYYRRELTSASGRRLAFLEAGR